MATEFDPRRAEPDTEFGYTTNEDREIGADDDVPEGWQVTGADPETGKRTVTQFGVQKTLKADGEGIVRPRNEEEDRLLTGFGLPVARSAKAAERAAETKKTSEAPDDKKE